MHFTHPHAPPCTPLLLRVQILKSDWPLKWASFIPDIVAASKTSETLCENTMRILRLLSEEVFDFARIDLTQAKTKVVWGSVGLGGTCVWGGCVPYCCGTGTGRGRCTGMSAGCFSSRGAKLAPITEI